MCNKYVIVNQHAPLLETNLKYAIETTTFGICLAMNFCSVYLYHHTTWIICHCYYEYY